MVLLIDIYPPPIPPPLANPITNPNNPVPKISLYVIGNKSFINILLLYVGIYKNHYKNANLHNHHQIYIFRKEFIVLIIRPL